MLLSNVVGRGVRRALSVTSQIRAPLSSQGGSVTTPVFCSWNSVSRSIPGSLSRTLNPALAVGAGLGSAWNFSGMAKKVRKDKSLTQLDSTVDHGEAKLAALELTLKQIEKSFGRGAVQRMGSDTNKMALQPDQVISTGSLGLDMALGIGGLPRGRIVEMYGPESSGKTTLALHVIAEAQKIPGAQCTFVDAEHALDPVYASSLGVDTDNLYVCQPDSGEQALEITDALVRSNAMDVIVVDSVAALVPRAEIEGDMGELPVGLQARIMSHGLRKLTGAVSKSKTLLVFVNQLRMKIGVMFGNPETTPGGMALKYHSSVRLDIRKVATLKKGDVINGHQVRVKVIKNKFAPPHRTADFDLIFGSGICRASELIDLGIRSKVLEKSGAWYSYRGAQIGQGREKVKAFLEVHPEVADEITSAIVESRLRVAAAGGSFDDEEEGGDEVESPLTASDEGEVSTSNDAGATEDSVAAADAAAAEESATTAADTSDALAGNEEGETTTPTTPVVA